MTNCHRKSYKTALSLFNFYLDLWLAQGRHWFLPLVVDPENTAAIASNVFLHMKKEIRGKKKMIYDV